MKLYKRIFALLHDEPLTDEELWHMEELPSTEPLDQRLWTQHVTPRWARFRSRAPFLASCVEFSLLTLVALMAVLAFVRRSL